MIKNVLRYSLLCLCIVFVCGCQNKKVPLDKDQFTALLIDMHRVDGTLTVGGRTYGNDELKNYAYYNDLFKKYGITRADFDSCMFYYSAQTVMFSKMYDVIIDSLNKQLTGVDKVLNELKANDSVNYFPVLDTMRLDTVVTVVVDSIVPGLYKFGTVLKFDSLAPNRTRKIVSYFLSADETDTLKVHDLIVIPDTNNRSYSWSQYADSVYSRLVIRYMEVVPENKRVHVDQKGKIVKNKKEKLYDPKDFGVQSMKNELFRPYISRESEKRLKQGLRRR